MTNLTDEGLSVIAHDVLKNRWFGKQSSEAYDSLHGAFASALQQVRDAAKKEERERCASYLDSLIRDYYNEDFFPPVPENERARDAYAADVLRRTLPRYATAIRQMDGGK